MNRINDKFGIQITVVISLFFSIGEKDFLLVDRHHQQVIFYDFCSSQIIYAKYKIKPYRRFELFYSHN